MKRFVLAVFLLIFLVSGLNAAVITYDQQYSNSGGSFVVMQSFSNPMPLDEGYFSQNAVGFTPFDYSNSVLSSYDGVTGSSSDVYGVFLDDAISGSAGLTANSTYGDLTTASSDGVVQVKFTIDKDCDYSLNGFVYSSMDSGYAYISIRDASSYELIFKAESAWESGQQINFNETGNLLADQYIFEAYSNAWTGNSCGSAGYQFNLGLTEVPEPMTVIILGLGGVFLRTRRG